MRVDGKKSAGKGRMKKPPDDPAVNAYEYAECLVCRSPGAAARRGGAARREREKGNGISTVSAYFRIAERRREEMDILEMNRKDFMNKKKRRIQLGRMAKREESSCQF